ncbi:MAG: phosphoglycerate dehydrogenase [Alphaproteobacteria bacterium]|nr:phosphoglycerate dehydrogenase [Alphaproteobacteria bacterium]
MPKVLISDAMSDRAAEIFRERGVDVDVKTGLKPAELIAIIGDYDGVAIRSSSKVTADVIAAGKNLRVIGRAGIGVDNVDVPAATARGIVVMNTPYGNAITTAEHAISLMLATARQIPEANQSTKAGKWEKNRFMGVEVTGKTLGIIGCGNIGAIVADRGRGLRMKVVAYDPFLSPEKAKELGVERVELDVLFKRADFISLHTPLTDQTRNIIDAAAITKMKQGVRIINCARGGLVVEKDLLAALDSGHVAAAALDVFEVEPATDNPLFAHENVIATPHLGASTTEAQENVALQVAEQMADFLIDGAVTNALNMPSLSAEEAALLAPYMKLAEQLGMFAGQLTETGIKEVELEYEGVVADLNTKALTSTALCGLLTPLLSNVNVVSAPSVARERGIRVSETMGPQQGAYHTYMRLTVVTENQRRSVAGTLFADRNPRIIQVKGIDLEAELGPHMLYVTNEDKPGFIGRLGTVLGEAGVNIATFHLGREKAQGNAIALIEVDEAISDAVLASVRDIPMVVQAKALNF